MKTKTKFFNRFILLLLATFVLSCSDDDNAPVVVEPEPEEQNIVEIALGTPDLSILVSALSAADGDLVALLGTAGPFTVLAPTNAAFTAFLASNGFASLDDVPTDVLSQILLNHVISADITSGDLVAAGAGYASTNASGVDDNFISTYFNTSNGVRFNNVAAVTTPDIDASNGVIHIVDAVIPIPSILNLAASNPDFSSLVVALGAADGDLIN